MAGTTTEERGLLEKNQVVIVEFGGVRHRVKVLGGPKTDRQGKYRGQILDQDFPGKFDDRFFNFSADQCMMAQ